ncbi:hypothetical protein JXA34_01630 [Patescibacteria group bacterium]|nr:hypothetical protein [Patescibacteria group bacterium]
MENFENTLSSKDNKNNNDVIKWLVLFPPLGLARIWTKSTWKTSVKVLLTLMEILYLGFVLFSAAYPIWKTRQELNF